MSTFAHCRNAYRKWQRPCNYNLRGNDFLVCWRHVASCCFMLLPVASCCFLLLPVASCCFLWLRFASICFSLLPFASFCFDLLRFASFLVCSIPLLLRTALRYLFGIGSRLLRDCFGTCSGIAEGVSKQSRTSLEAVSKKSRRKCCHGIL